MSAIIYKISNNINQKAYIGVTITQLNERWNRHICDSKKERNNMALHAAIRKYGKENFTIQVLETTEDTIHAFEVLESKYIKEHKTHGTEGGYNMTYGGEGWNGMKHSPETIEKMRIAKLGKKASEETKKKLSERMKGSVPWNKGIECPQIGEAQRGILYTEEEKQKLSESHKGKSHDQSTKDKIAERNSTKHVLINPSGEIIKIFNLNNFCKKNNISAGNLMTLGKTKGYQMISSDIVTKKYTIIDTRTNEKIITENLAQTCKNLGFSNAGLLNKHKRGKPYIHWKIENVEEIIITKHYK